MPIDFPALEAATKALMQHQLTFSWAYHNVSRNTGCRGFLMKVKNTLKIITKHYFISSFLISILTLYHFPMLNWILCIIYAVQLYQNCNCSHYFSTFPLLFYVWLVIFFNINKHVKNKQTITKSSFGLVNGQWFQYSWNIQKKLVT